MPPYLITTLYGVAIAYAALAYLVGENGIIMIEVIGFGLPMILWLALEWIAPLSIAVFMGFQARTSIVKALLGAPIVVLYCLVTPTVHARNIVLPALIPWLAAFPSSLNQALPIIQERLVLWGCVFLAAVVLGRIGRVATKVRSCSSD